MSNASPLALSLRDTQITFFRDQIRQNQLAALNPHRTTKKGRRDANTGKQHQQTLNGGNLLSRGLSNGGGISHGSLQPLTTLTSAGAFSNEQVNR